MYQPTGADNIWVSLGMGVWGWSATVTRDVTVPWTVGAFDPLSPPQMVPAVVTGTRDLPEWQAVLKP